MTAGSGTTAGSPAHGGITGGPILVVDTATTRAVVAIGGPDGAMLGERTWTAGYRHGEELLERIDGLLRDTGIDRSGLGGLVVGTGPGAFTGLRVGLATVKGLAHALRLPVVGIGTGEALLAAARPSATGDVVLLQPAGPSDRVVTRHGEPPRILPGGEEPALRPTDTLVAVDLEGRAQADATGRGERAHAGLARALLVAGAARLAAGAADDLARLVPEYVTLPRGVRAPAADDGVEVTGGVTAR
jgi:tRNA threonylcarbamoyl adenosine modification protein YeaZ